jgi:hypothetical protein
MSEFLKLVLAAVLSGSVVAALVGGAFSMWTSNSTIQQKNVELAMQVSESHLEDNPEQVAIYAAIMAGGGLIPRDLGCSIVGLALFTGKGKPDVFNGVIAALPASVVDKDFSSAPCNLKGFSAPAVVSDAPAQTTGQDNCPTGKLYTQLGRHEQQTAGKQLKAAFAAAVPKAVVTSPEIVAQFDAANPVVRYFFREKEDAARLWQAAIETAIPGVDVKYAYIPGYEAAIGSDSQDTFELWWPKSVPIGNVRAPQCVTPADG